ncbi:hypothetical protein FQZ97_531140 [compost metagenome]
MTTSPIWSVVGESPFRLTSWSVIRNRADWPAVHTGAATLVLLGKFLDMVEVPSFRSLGVLVCSSAKEIVGGGDNEALGKSSNHAFVMVAELGRFTPLKINRAVSVPIFRLVMLSLSQRLFPFRFGEESKQATLYDVPLSEPDCSRNAPLFSSRVVLVPGCVVG